MKEICQREGFIPNIKDKTKYYRCLRLRSGELVLYEFSCNSKKIWNQIKETCLNPGNVIETDDSTSEEGNNAICA